MTLVKNFSFAIVLTLLPLTAAAQSTMTVIGGNEQARECYRNANSVGVIQFISGSMLEPCSYALENVSLSVRDRGATMANRGILHNALRDYEAAFSDFEVALSLLPDQPEIFVSRGNAYFLTGNLAMALEDYNRALELGIDETHAVHVNLGMTYQRLNDYNRAETYYREALESMPNWEPAMSRLENLLRLMQARENERQVQ